MLLDDKPNFCADEAEAIAYRVYRIHSSAKELPSYQDQNFLLDTSTGEKYVLKIANSQEDEGLLDAQNQVMDHLGREGLPIPQLLPSMSGEEMVKVENASGEKHWVRLVTYLPGAPLADLKRQSKELLTDIGRHAGRLSKVLAGFDHPELHRWSQWDLRICAEIIDEYLPLVEDQALRELVETIVAGFRERSKALLPNLREAVVHNDLNDYNLLVGGGDDLYSKNQQVVGIIDFGDMLHSIAISELVITVAYAILDKPDPLAAAMAVVAGYNMVYPLKEDEIAILLDLVCMRLCTSICLAAYKLQEYPDDDYIAISQAPIRRTLPELVRIPSGFAEATFRAACKLEPFPRGRRIRDRLAGSADFFPLFGEELGENNCTVIDLSVDSPLIGGREPLENGLKLKTSLKDTLDLTGVKFGVSRYAEVRLRSVGAAEQIPDDRTNLHLGVDLYADADSPIFSPCEGVVFAYSPANTGDNCLSTVILRHSTPYEGQFYTLFRGHFDGDDTILEVGRILEKGERFGVFRLPPDDDQHVPYLHFQVITDLLDLGFQFPGYCAYDQVEIWKHFSLDPNLILGIPAACFPPATNDKAQTRAMRRELIGPSLSISYREPVKVVRGWMQYLYDETGRRYVDAYNNVPHVGHSHPRVVQAAVEQIGVLNTNTRYLHDNLVRYAEALTKTVPEPLSMCFFVNSGSEANELAMRLSRAYTGAKDLIVLEAAYHGHTTSLVDISPYKHDGLGGEGPPSWVHTAPIPDIYRGAYKGDDPAAGDKYSSHVGEIIKQVEARDGSLAGYIAETYPSVGGQIIPPEGYFAAVYDLVRAAGGVCIADEVQTGYGRTGEHFYAFEGQDVVPDILVLGKPIGNGHPLGAVITTPEIAAAFDNGMEFFSTFGGNTVSCAVGLSVLEVVLDERLQSHAHRVGGFLLEKLGTLARRYPIVGDVRGAGLFLGVELVRDRETLQPATEEAAFICNRMRDLGVLLGTDGPYHNVLKIRPPMPFDFDDADRLVVALELVLEQDFQKF